VSSLGLVLLDASNGLALMGFDAKSVLARRRSSSSALIPNRALRHGSAEHTGRYKEREGTNAPRGGKKGRVYLEFGGRVEGI